MGGGQICDQFFCSRHNRDGGYGIPGEVMVGEEGGGGVPILVEVLMVTREMEDRNP